MKKRMSIVVCLIICALQRFGCAETEKLFVIRNNLSFGMQIDVVVQSEKQQGIELVDFSQAEYINETSDNVLSSYNSVTIGGYSLSTLFYIFNDMHQLEKIVYEIEPSPSGYSTVEQLEQSYNDIESIFNEKYLNVAIANSSAIDRFASRTQLGQDNTYWLSLNSWMLSLWMTIYPINTLTFVDSSTRILRYPDEYVMIRHYSIFNSTIVAHCIEYSHIDKAYMDQVFTEYQTMMNDF